MGIGTSPVYTVTSILIRRIPTRLKETDRFLFLVIFSNGLLHVLKISLAPLLPLMQAEFGLSYTKVGILTSILTLCGASSGIFAGIVADKADKIKVILSVLLLISIFSATMVLTSTFLTALLFLIFLYISIGLFLPPIYSYMARRYLETRGKIFGIFETGGSVGVLIGPITAGVISSYLGWRWVYTLWALPIFAIAYLFYRFSLKNRVRSKREDRDDEIDKKELLNRKSLSNFLPRLKIIFLAQGFFGFISGGTISFLPLFLKNVHNFSVGNAGGVLTLFLAGGMAGKMIGGKYSDIWNPKKVITVAFLTTSLSLFLVPLISSFSLVIVLLFAGVTLFMALPALAFLTSELKTADLGLAYGIQFLIGNGSGAFSNFLSGLIGDVFGIEYIFFLLSAVAFSAGIFLCFFFNQTNYQSVPS